MEKKYSVWVGGVEVNSDLLSKEDAETLMAEYKNDDYDDVVIICNSDSVKKSVC